MQSEAQVILQEVSKILETDKVYLVGGCVRDILLNKIPTDYDLTTSLTPDQVEEKVKQSGKRVYKTGKRFGTIGCKIKVNDEYKFVEITTFRTEQYNKTRKPNVQFVKSLKQDLARRDFTINALALDINGKIHDYFDGKKHLEEKLLKTVQNPLTSFKDDPLRMLRAARFASTLNFKIDTSILDSITKLKFSLLNVSKERWVQELDKILLSEKPSIGLNILQEAEIFKLILPEISLQYKFDQQSPYHSFDLWEHTLKVVDGVPKDNLNLRWCALLHDVGKPFTKKMNDRGYANYIGHELVGAEISLKISEYLRFSNERKEYIYNIILNHLDDKSILRKYDNAAK